MAVWIATLLSVGQGLTQLGLGPTREQLPTPTYGLTAGQMATLLLKEQAVIV